MPVALGTQTPSAYKLGSTTVSAVYMGGTKVWPAAATGPIPTSGLQLWLDADDASTFSYSSGSVVSQWRDKSGGGHHADANVGQTTPTRDVTINGRTALYFHSGSGQGTALFVPAFAAAYTAAEVFIVLDLVTDNGGSYLYAFGTDTQFSHYTAGTVVYENFGTNARKALGTPPIDLTQPHIYNVRTSAGNYVGAFNGVVLYNSGPNTVAFRSTGNYEITQFANSPNGYMGEFIMYDRVLTTPERQQVETYLTTKWIPAPPIPTSGLAGWWDADDATTFSYSSGALVSQWRDKSGNLNHLAPGVSPSRNGSQNGRTTVAFAQQWLAASTPASYWKFLHDGTPYSLFITVKIASGATYAGVLGTSNSTPGFDVLSVSANRDLRHWVSAGGDGSVVGNTSTTNVYTFGTWFVYGVIADPANATPAARSSLRINGGTPIVANTQSGTPTTTAANALTIGTRTGADINTTWLPAGSEVAEVCIYNRVLTTPERQQVEAYLTNKWMPFTPSSLTGLAGWWDADDAASITASAGAVSQWNDKSGGNRHLTHTALYSDAITGTRTINGRNVLDFPTHTQYATPAFTAAQPVTMFAVAQSDVTAASNSQIIAYVNSGTIMVWANNWAMYAGSGFVSSAILLDTVPHVASAVYNGASSQLWLDGTSIATGNPGSNGFTAGVAVGSDGSGNWDGLIAEVVVYNRALTTPERQQVEAYLKTKWNTP